MHREYGESWEDFFSFFCGSICGAEQLILVWDWAEHFNSLYFNQNQTCVYVYIFLQPAQQNFL